MNIKDDPRKGGVRTRKRSIQDRRSSEDRRKAYDLNYFVNGGVERRKMPERRLRKDDRRKGWGMVGPFTSVPAGI